MLITPVFILLCIIAIMGVIIFGIGICKEDTEPTIIGVIMIFLVAFAFGLRSEEIEKEATRKLCIEKGYKVEKVLGNEVCDI